MNHHTGAPPIPPSSAVVMFRQWVIAHFAAVVLEKPKHLPSSPGLPSAGHGEIILLVEPPSKSSLMSPGRFFCYNNAGVVSSPAVSDS